MTRHRFAVPLLVVALAVTSVGWWRASNPGSGDGRTGRFTSCVFDGQSLTLGYFYGANQLVAPTVDDRSGRIVVSLREVRGEGPTLAIGLGGSATFATSSGGPVVYPDGTPLRCSDRSSAG
jgi:hypothetical protein